MKKLALVVVATLIGAATLSSTGIASTRGAPKSAGEYMFPNEAPFTADPVVSRRKANYR
jgi:hypothetical protein